MWQWKPTRFTDAELVRPQGCTFGVAVLQVEAELRIVLPGGDVRVRVGVHARRDTEQDVRGRLALAVQHVEAIQLVETVDDDTPHARCDPQPQLVEALVVAVHHARRGGHPGGEHDVQLAAAGDVEKEALVVHDAGDCSTEEGLRRIDHATDAEGGHGIATSGTHVIDVVHEQRRAEPSGHVE